MNLLVIIKLTSLFLGVLFSMINIGRLYVRQRIPFMNFVFQTIGLLGFIIIQFKLYI